MPYTIQATLTSKGQVTLPAELRRRWGLTAGDRVEFRLDDFGTVQLSRRTRRSILRTREDLAPLTPPRPVTQADIDRAVADAMAEQDLRLRGGAE